MVLPVLLAQLEHLPQKVAQVALNVQLENTVHTKEVNRVWIADQVSFHQQILQVANHVLWVLGVYKVAHLVSHAALATTAILKKVLLVVHANQVHLVAVVLQHAHLAVKEHIALEQLHFVFHAQLVRLLPLIKLLV